MKSKLGFHVMVGRNNAAHNSIRLMVVGGNTYWERMFVSAIMVVRRDGFCCWRRESAIGILLILMPRQYS